MIEWIWVWWRRRYRLTGFGVGPPQEVVFAKSDCFGVVENEHWVVVKLSGPLVTAGDPALAIESLNDVTAVDRFVVKVVPMTLCRVCGKVVNEPLKLSFVAKLERAKRCGFHLADGITECAPMCTNPCD